MSRERAWVKRGEAIAKVGTGNSSEPHLHFQLQDGKDFLTANGLPVTFEDARTMDALFGIEANAYWGTTVISLPVK